MKVTAYWADKKRILTHEVMITNGIRPHINNSIRPVLPTDVISYYSGFWSLIHRVGLYTDVTITIKGIVIDFAICGRITIDSNHNALIAVPIDNVVVRSIIIP